MEQSIHFLHSHFLMLWSTNGIKYHANPLPVSCPSGTHMSSAQGDQEHGCRGFGHPYVSSCNYFFKNIFQKYIRADKREMYNSYQNYFHL